MNDSDSPNVLIGRHVRKTFRRESGEEVDALKDVSIDVAHGTLTALVGPDGAGKTTLIRLAAGLMLPDAGDLRVLGIDVAAEPQRVQARVFRPEDRLALGIEHRVVGGLLGDAYCGVTALGHGHLCFCSTSAAAAWLRLSLTACLNSKGA